MLKEKYDLVGIDGNAFSVIGYTRKAMKEQGYSTEEIKCYEDRVMKNNYSYLISESANIIIECNKRVLDRESNEKMKLENRISEKKSKRNREELDSYFNILFEKYVPNCGKSDTVGGEIVRAFCRIDYRWFNDGDYAGYGYGMGTAGPACTYLIGIPELEDSVENVLNIVDHEEMYEKALLTLGNDVADYLDENPNLFEEKNEEDYQDCDDWCGDLCEEDERRHWGDDSWYDEYEDDEYDEDDEYEDDEYED